MDNYRYYLNNIEVFPLNKDNLKYNYEKKIKSGIVFEKVLETSLIFKYDQGSFNFKTQEETDKCTELNFVVVKRCGNTNETFFEGVFSISEGQFDDDSCKYTVKVRVKRDLLYDVEVNFLQTPNRVYEGLVYGVVADAFGYRNYTQARYFDKTVLYVAQKSNPKITGIISNFFQINPDGAFYLPGVTNYWQYMVFCNLSDVQEPIPSNESTKGIITFQDLMDDLQVLFDVFWFIDSNYKLRIEHRIWFEGNQGLDLTLSKYEKYLQASNKYEYDLEGYPKQEVWKIQGHAQSVKLSYGGVSSVKKNENAKMYQTRKINTDYRARFNYGGADEGLFLFATDGGANIFNYWLMINDYAPGLGKVDTYYLVKNLHTYNRPSIYSLIEVIDDNNFFNKAGGLVLNTNSPTKKQVEISIPLCCEDEFDTKDQILTDMGTGYLEKATFETKSNLLKLELKYKVPNCNDFEPDDLDSLDLWLKEGDHVLSGIKVAQWNDSSGNARHAVQAVNANRPDRLLNQGSYMVVFDNSAKWLTTPAFQLFPNKRGTVIILFEYLGVPSAIPAGGKNILSTNTGGAGVYFDIGLNINDELISNNEANVYPQVIQTFGDLLQNGGLFVVNRFEDTFIKTKQNSVDPLNNPVSNSNTQVDSNPLIIGTNLNNIPVEGNEFSVREIIIYGRSLTEEEQEKIDYYLVKKGIYKIYPA